MATNIFRLITSFEQNFCLLANTLYSPNQIYYWPLDFDEAHLLIQNFIDPSDLEDESTKDWDLERYMHSALFFYLEKTFEICKLAGSPLLSTYKWSLIVNLILNTKISKETLIFVKNLGILKISQKDDIFKGCSEALERPLAFEEHFKNDKDRQSLENLLYFLSVDKKKIDSLVDQAFKTKNLKPIIDYFATAKLEINEKFIFN